MINDRSEIYWAAEAEIADEILNKVDKYYKFLSESGRAQLLKNSYNQYYKSNSHNGRLLSVNEYQGLSINHYQNLLQHLEVMTSSSRPYFEPRASNSDMRSTAQVILAAGLLDYYLREKKVERNIRQAVKECLLFGTAFISLGWNATAGKIYGQSPTGAAIYEGDIECKNYNDFTCIRDFNQNNVNHDWYILKDLESKYNLAMKYPHISQEILDNEIPHDQLSLVNQNHTDDNDQINVYTFVHRPTPALPHGRYVQVLDNNTVLLDGPIPYKDCNVFRITPDEQVGSVFGTTVGFSLLPIQETLDILYSAAATNQSTFATQNILVPKGSDLNSASLSGGLNVIEYDSQLGKPEALNLTQTPPEVFNYMQMLERLSETLSGVNSVARGNPESSLKSGSALALVQSQAIAFSQSLQQSYAQLLEDVGTGIVELLKVYAQVPRIAAIAGKANRPIMREFKGDDLDQINRVIVDMGNPLTRSLSGKVNLAEQLMQFGLIDNPDQYIQVLTTGRLEHTIQGKQSELMLIKAENEQLMDGIPQRALITDSHAQHILEHKVVLASPEIRLNPNSPVIAATLEHIQEHINFLQTGDPALLNLIHQQSLPPSQPSPQIAPQLNPQSGSIQDKADAVNMPNPPQNTEPNTANIIKGQQ